jgi:Peptidase S24-like
MSEQANHRREDIILSLAMETLRSFGEFQFVAWGSSMVPSLFPGDTLIVRRAAPEDACNGDVVLLARKGRFYAHRLVDRKMAADGPIQLITRGDALGKNDPPFSENELLGHVTAVLRRGRRIELAWHPDAGQRLLRWVVQRSGGSVKWLLRCHSLRARLSRTSPSAGNQAELQPRGAV